MKNSISKVGVTFFTLEIILKKRKKPKKQQQKKEKKKIFLLASPLPRAVIYISHDL